MNSKKKPHLEEEEKEEEEEEETFTALDGNEVSHEKFDMDACDHSKQGLESQISPKIQNDPESEVTDGCDPSRSALDGSEVSHENFLWMQMINPKKDQYQRLVQKTKRDQNQK